MLGFDDVLKSKYFTRLIVIYFLLVLNVNAPDTDTQVRNLGSYSSIDPMDNFFHLIITVQRIDRNQWFRWLWLGQSSQAFVPNISNFVLISIFTITLCSEGLFTIILGSLIILIKGISNIKFLINCIIFNYFISYLINHNLYILVFILVFIKSKILLLCDWLAFFVYFWSHRRI